MKPCPPIEPGSERSTRARVARLILEHGPIAAAALGERLGLTPAAVRRHLDALLADGMIEPRTVRPRGAARARAAGQAVRHHRRGAQCFRARLRRPGRERAALPGRAHGRGSGGRLRPFAGVRPADAAGAGHADGAGRPAVQVLAQALSAAPVTEKFGALAPIYGTVVTSAIAIILAVPLGIGIAIFLTELCPAGCGARSASRSSCSPASLRSSTASGACSCSRRSCRRPCSRS